MVTLGSLLVPILLAAALVWVTSVVIWVLLPHHKSDFKALPDEDAARGALIPQDLSPGIYNVPHCVEQADLKKPEVVQKFEEGPVAFVTVLPRGTPKMGKAMILSVVFYLVVSLCVGYVGSATLPIGTEYLKVFQVTGTVAWLAYGAAVVPEAIWFGRPWGYVLKIVFVDALLMGLVTAGAFGATWPS